MLDPKARPRLLFAICGSRAETSIDDRVSNWLRRPARNDVGLGVASRGRFRLLTPDCRAGLLGSYGGAAHWENAPAFAERWPEVALSDHIHVIDRGRYVCSGGAATIDRAGGAAEMRLIAVAPDSNPGHVAAHHLVRIMVIPPAFRRRRRFRGAGSGGTHGCGGSV